MYKPNKKLITWAIKTIEAIITMEYPRNKAIKPETEISMEVRINKKDSNSIFSNALNIE